MRNNKIIQKTVKWFLYFLILIPFLRLRTLQDLPMWLQKSYNYLAVLSCTLILFYTMSRKNIDRSKVVLPIIIMMLTYIFITLLNNRKYLDTTYRCIFFIAIALFINIELDKEPLEVIKFLAFVYSFIVLLNNILVFLFPKGLYKGYLYHTGHLLGDDNAIIYVALPAMVILTIYSLIKHRKITKFTWFNLILCEIVFIKLWAASAIIAFGLFIAMVFISTNFIKLPPMKLFIGLIVFCIIVFVGLNSTFITNLITNYLHKDITFSGRTVLWKNGFEMIKKKPILGYGGYFKEGRSYLGIREYPIHTTHLQILVDGGAILFGEYILICVLAFKKMSKYFKSNISQVLCAGLIAIGISYTFEQAELYHFIILIVFAFNIEKIINISKGDEKEIDNSGTVQQRQ